MQSVGFFLKWYYIPLERKSAADAVFCNTKYSEMQTTFDSR